jgi:hypothetical protein
MSGWHLNPRREGLRIMPCQYFTSTMTLYMTLEKVLKNKLEMWLVLVTLSEWASPISPVLGKDDAVRIVVDFEKPINPQTSVY